ncbi:MAG TPA: DUF5678 domain-containing protein [Dehalococcoidia bacterium]|nr:DUF5678 domain-containing protein [Dehalococcoidia bacterium]
MTTNAADKALRSFLENQHPGDESAKLSDVEYIADHHNALLKKHPEQWIAIRDGEVVAVGQDFLELKAGAAARGIAITSTVTVFLTREKQNLVL